MKLDLENYFQITKGNLQLLNKAEANYFQTKL